METIRRSVPWILCRPVRVIGPRAAFSVRGGQRRSPLAAVQLVMTGLLVGDIIVVMVELFIEAEYPSCAYIVRDAVSCCAAGSDDASGSSSYSSAASGSHGSSAHGSSQSARHRLVVERRRIRRVLGVALRGTLRAHKVVHYPGSTVVSSFALTLVPRRT